MAPGNKERHPGHTGTIPKTKARNNCNVPQEAVTPTRRDMANNLGTTSLDWVPVSEYNTRSNSTQTRQQINNTSDQELTDLDNSVTFESGFGRFVQVRPQPRALPLTVQNREQIPVDHQEDAEVSLATHSSQPYVHQTQNGLIPHSNHATAAVMIVNPTTPNAVAGSMPQPFNAPNQNRNNLTRNINSTRNTFDVNSSNNNNTTPPITNQRSGTKSVNLMNNMNDQGLNNFNNIDTTVHRQTARALGEAIVAACPDAAAVERRLLQIREYIRVTASLVDTMRNSEDEAFVEHTKQEYDELVGMVMQLKESESKLESILNNTLSDNTYMSHEDLNSTNNIVETNIVDNTPDIDENGSERNINDGTYNKNSNDNIVSNNTLKKVTNIENEQINKTMAKSEETQSLISMNKTNENKESEEAGGHGVEIREIESILGPAPEPESKQDDQHLNDMLKKNILSCVEKIALIEEMKNNTKDSISNDDQHSPEIIVRPMSGQSNNGSLYSENEIWQNEIKNKVEVSQARLSALKSQQKRLLKYQAEAKQQLEELQKEEESDGLHEPSTSQESYSGVQQNVAAGQNYHHSNRMYAANQIGVATTLPQTAEAEQQLPANMDLEHTRSTNSNNSQDERYSFRDGNIPNSMAITEDLDEDNPFIGEDEATLRERARILQIKMRELQRKKQNMDCLMSEFQKLQMFARIERLRNTYSSSGEDSGDEEQSRNKAGVNLNNEDPFKLMEINAIKTALQKTKDLMRSVETFESDQLSVHEEAFHTPNNSNINDNKSDGAGSMSGWSNEGSVCRVRNSLPQRHKFTNEQLSQQQQHNQQQIQLHQQQLQQQQQQQIQPHQQIQQHQQMQQHQQIQHQQIQHHQQVQHQQIQIQQQQKQQQIQQLQHAHQVQQHNQQQMQQHQQQMQQHQQQMQQHQQQIQQHQQQIQQQQQQQQQQPMSSHEANINSLQELAQELRMETEKVMGERARIKDIVTNKEQSRKNKKVNEEVQRASGSMDGGVASAAERRLMQLRALLSDKQRELDSLLNKQVINGIEDTNVKTDSRPGSVVNQSYTSDQEEPESRSGHIPMDSQNSRETDNFRAGGDSALGTRSANTAPSHIGSTYGSDSDSASRNKSNQRNRSRRRPAQERQTEEVNLPLQNNSNPNVRHEPRQDTNINVNVNPPITPNGDISGNIPYSHLPPPQWNTNKSNQDMRTNQFTQNSHSQTMERLLGTPHMSFPPTLPYNMMMPYGMVGGCGCGCGFWGAWCWQQLVLQQREIHALRDQLAHLEERWRAETASHTLNNQVPPGNRANNYWDNFRSYSRQNLLSANSKTNADGHLSVGPSHNPHPLVERSHNTLHHTSSSTSPSVTPKRNTNTAGSSQCITQSAQPNNDDTINRNAPRNVAYERSLSFSSAPDVLNVNQNVDADTTTPHTRNIDDVNPANVSNLNMNRPEQTANTFRNLNYTNPIPEIIQSHSNNLNTPANAKKKSSTKLPSKNSANRRNYSLDFSQTSNINIASTSDMNTPNPNLASTSSEAEDKATSKLFDLLRENIYSEVTTLIGVNESHPDFLIQLFRELQLISSEQLRQKVLQSIRGVLSQYSSLIDSQTDSNHEEPAADAITTTSGDTANCSDCNGQNACSSTMQLDNKVVRFLLLNSEEVFNIELIESLATLILNRPADVKQTKRLCEILSKYEGMRVCDVSSNIVENLPLFVSGSNDGDESTHLPNEISESSILQDVAGSLNLFSSSETQLHQINSCPYDIWPGHVHVNIDGGDLNDNSQRSSQDGKVDLINCSEMNNGDLAEADQTCHTDVTDGGVNGHEELATNTEALPDVVDTDEVTPTEDSLKCEFIQEYSLFVMASGRPSAEAEWLGLDRVPTRLHMEEPSEKQKDKR